MSTGADRLGTGDYRSLGLVANPFKNLRNRSGETIGQSLEMQAMGNRVLARLDEMATAERGRTLWVEKSDQINNYYHRGALVHIEEVLIRDEDFDVLPAYVQLFAAKIGRVRSVMNVVAERLATKSFDRTLAAWVQQVVAEPDTSLPQFEQIAAEKWGEFVSAVRSDAVQAVNDHFGEFIVFRKIEAQPPADIRLASLEEEPEEIEESPEDDEMTAQIPDYDGIDPSVIMAGEEVESGPDAVVEYLIAHTKAHLSPVIARGLRQYYERGFGPLSEELKITKAPLKTLKALCRMANMRFRKVVILLDGYDNWVFMPEDLRIKYITALTEIRLSLGKDAAFAFFVSTNQAAELDEHFGGSDRVTLDFPNLLHIGESPDVFDTAVVDSWVESATIVGSQAPSMGDAVWEPLVEHAAGSLPAFCAMADAAVDDAARRGVSAVDEAAVQAGLAAAPESES